MTSYPSWFDLFLQNVSLPPDQGASLPPSVGPINDPLAAALRAQRFGTPEGASTYPFVQDMLRFLMPNGDWVDERLPQDGARRPEAALTSNAPTAAGPWQETQAQSKAANAASATSPAAPNFRPFAVGASAWGNQSSQSGTTPWPSEAPTSPTEAPRASFDVADAVPSGVATQQPISQAEAAIHIGLRGASFGFSPAIAGVLAQSGQSDFVNALMLADSMGQLGPEQKNDSAIDLKEIT
jgi:hypothetical protein